MEERSSQPVKLFYCYARKDQLLRNELDKHLATLRHADRITDWYDGKIIPGTSWPEEIKAQLDAADLILLLISPDFLASDYCYSIESKRALERHERGEARVIPIILRPISNWQGTPFGKLQALPEDAEPITAWQNTDAAFVNVAEGIRRIVEEILEISQVVPPPPPPPEQKKRRLGSRTVWGKIQSQDFPSAWHVLKVPFDTLAIFLIGSFILGAIVGAIWGVTGFGVIMIISRYIQIFGFSYSQMNSSMNAFALLFSVLGAIVGGIYLWREVFKSANRTLVLMPEGFVDFSPKGDPSYIVSYKAVEDIRFDSTRGILIVTMSPLSLEVKIKNFNESPRLIAQRVEGDYTSFKASSSPP